MLMIITTNRRGFIIHPSSREAYREFALERSTGNRFIRVIHVKKQWIVNQFLGE